MQKSFTETEFKTRNQNVKRNAELNCKTELCAETNSCGIKKRELITATLSNSKIAESKRGIEQQNAKQKAE